MVGWSVVSLWVCDWMDEGDVRVGRNMGMGGRNLGGAKSYNLGQTKSLERVD